MRDKKPVLARLFAIADRDRWKMIVSCGLTALARLIGMMPYVSVYAISKVLLLGEGAVENTIVLWGSIAALSILLNGVFTYFGSLTAHKAAFSILYEIRIHIMAHLGRLPMGFFCDNTSGSVQKTMDDSIEQIEIFVAHILPDLVGSACAVVALLVGLGSLNLWIALSVVLAVVGGSILQLLVWGGNRGQDILTGVASVSSKMTGAFSEYVRGIAEVKLFGLTGTVTRGLEEATNKYGDWENKLYNRSAPYYEGYKTIILSLLSVVLPVGVVLIKLNPGDPMILLGLIMGLIITPAICSPLMELVNYGTRMGQISVALYHIDQITHIEPIASIPNPKEPSHYDVAFHNVSFSYQDTSDPLHTYAIRELTMEAKQNEMTALVGPSGGGKSTIGQLISRFWDVTNGKITIGGIDIREIEPTRLMTYVSYVFQDTFIFSDTVKGNITMNREASMDEIIGAAKMAQCHDFIMTLPEGYDTQIGNGGLGLSGGEVQRIAIARAILKDAPIVVLDEALAYSDAENENLIQKAIDQLIEDRTVIIIAHRLPSIKSADQIVVLNQGQIVERGTHSELMTQKDLYYELWSLQNEVDRWTLFSDVERYDYESNIK